MLGLPCSPPRLDPRGKRQKQVRASPDGAPGSEGMFWQGAGVPRLPVFWLLTTPRKVLRLLQASLPGNRCEPPHRLAWSRHNGQSGPRLCDITNGPALGTQSPGAGTQTHHELFPPPPLLTMRTLTWVLFLPLCLSCGCAFMFTSLREKAKEPQGKVPCGGHFRIRQNLPEHAQGWLGRKWLWLFFVVVLYVILKFRGDREKTKVKGWEGFPSHPCRLRRVRPGEARVPVGSAPGREAELSRRRGAHLTVLGDVGTSMS